MKTFGDLTVLVVDDNITMRTLMDSLLRGAGVGKVLLADGVETGLSWHETNHLDGAFIDLVLQEGSGLDIGRKLSAQNIPVVFCSGVNDDFNLSQMLEVGWIMPKPVCVAGIRRGLESFACHKARCLHSKCEERVA